MSSIDERIVKMTFDNSDFEGKISKTLSSLEKLNETLSKTGASDGINELNKALKDVKSQFSGLEIDTDKMLDVKKPLVNWEKLGNALTSLKDKIKIDEIFNKADSEIDEATDSMRGFGESAGIVQQKFSVLASVLDGMFLRIGSKIADVATNMVKGFTLDPIMDGFSEYELKMNSIQTILTNTAKHGTTLEDVNGALNKLNEYSDKTIYNFAQMTDNIGKATAAGLTLEDSVKFVQGMSNVAAGFGVDANAMAGATYQMTQALSAGVVKLQDWVSMERAGLGGEMLQEELIAMAKGMGKVVDTSVPFRDSLKDGWLTAEIFTKTMEKMAADEALTAAASNVTSFTKLLGTLKETIGSGWAQSFEHIFGNKTQSTELWTGISESLGQVINKSAEARNNMLSFWNANGGRDATIRGLTNVVQSLGKGLSAIGDAWKEVFPSMTGQKLVELSTKFRDLTYKIKMNDETAKKIKTTFKGIFDVFKVVKDTIVNVAKAFTPLGSVFGSFGSVLLSVTSGIGNFASNLAKVVSETNMFGKISTGINKAFDGISKTLNKVKNNLSEFFDYLGGMNFDKAFGMIGKGFGKLGDILGSVGTGVGKAIGTLNFETLFKMMQTASGIELLKTVRESFKEIGGVGEAFQQTAKDLSGIFKSFQGFGTKIKETLDQVRESLEAWQQNLKADTIKKIATSVLILAGALMIIGSIDGKSLARGLTGLAVVLAELVLAYGAIAMIGPVKGLGVASSLLSMASALLVLSLALKIISSINLEQMLTGLLGLGVMMLTMASATKLFNKSCKKLASTSKSLVVFGIAMMTMAGALKLLGSIDAETLGSGLFALAMVLSELALFLAAAKFGSLSTSTAGAVLILAAALMVLSQAVKLFGNFEPETIITALAGIGGVLAEIAIFSKLGGSGLNMVTLAVGLAAMSGAMLIMSTAVKSLGGIKWEVIGRGLTSMAGALAIIGVAGKLISGPKLLLSAVGIAAMSASLLVLSVALKSLGGQSWEEIGKSMASLAGSLLILGVAMYAMTGCIAGAAAMLVMAGALAIFTPQLIALSQLSLAQVGIGLLALAGALAVIGGAGYLLVGALPGLLGLAASIALFGAGAALAGAGMALFGTGFAAVAAAIAGSGLLIIEFIRQLIGLLPQIGTKLAEAFVNFSKVVSEGAPAIINAFTVMMTALITAISSNIPAIAQLGMDLILAFGQKLSEGIPQLANYGMDMILGLLKGIRDRMYEIVDVSLNVVTEFINGIAANLGSVIEAGINLALSFIEGVADGISNNKDRLEAAVEKVIQAMVDAGLAILQGGIDGFVKGGEELTQGLIDGIESLVTGVAGAAENLIDEAVDAVGDCGNALYSAGQSLVKGFTRGIESALSWVGTKAREIATKAKNAAEAALGINSPSRVFMEIGKYTAEGFAVGLDKYSGKAESASSELANKVIRNVQNPLSSLGQLIDGDIDVDPVITPVMDLSNVESGANKINGLLSNSSITVDSVTGRLAGSIGRIQNRTDNTDVISAIKDLKNSMGSGGTSYTINGITYDDGSNIQSAVETLIRAAMIERRM